MIEVAAGFERRLALERPLDLLLDVVQVEDGPTLGVQLDARQHVRHERAGEFLHVAKCIRLIDQHTFDVRAQRVAQDPQVQRQVRVHQIPGAGPQPLLPDEFPELAQVVHVGAQRLGRRVLGRGSHDVARGLLGLQGVEHRRAEALALGEILDSRRDAHAAALRHVHEVARRQRDVGGEPRAFRAQGVLDHLHQNLVSLGHQRAYVLGARRLDARALVARIEYVRRVQKCGPLQADLDERRLHARQHARDPSLVDVADQAAPAVALEEYLLKHAVLDHGGARLVGTRVDEDLRAHHPLAGAGARHRGTPADLNSCAVSYSGSPMTPE